MSTLSTVRRKLLGVCSVIALVVGAASVTEAATITFGTEFDLGNCNPFGVGGCIAEPSVTPVSIAVGDHVDFTLTFANNKAVTLTDDATDGNSLEQLIGYLRTTSNCCRTSGNGSITLLGTAGPVAIVSNQTISLTSGYLGVAATNFLAAGSSVTFTGYRVEFDVLSMPITQQTFGKTWVNFLADQKEIVDAPTAVPEPGSVSSLLLLGVASLATGRRFLGRNSQ